jgi:tRNA/rRNA methyltransferase
VHGPSFDKLRTGELLEENVRAITVENSQPIVAGTGLPVAEVVRACHDKTVDVALAELAVAGLTRENLEPVLTYCAEQRCRADGASCRGCRMHLAGLGVLTFDAFVDRHAEIRFRASSVILRGSGTETVMAESLDQLAKTWAGEDYWFWARRVLRKLRHGIRRARQSGAPPDAADFSPVFVLVRPQLADNIGMVARALANFGLEELRLIEPRDGWPNEKARIAASGANFIVDAVQAFSTLKEGMADLNWVAATSARQRDLAKPVLTPEQAVAEMRRRLCDGLR